MNSVVLIGRLARDPELRFTPQSSTAVAHMTLAVDRPALKGEEKKADFIRITAFGKQAETADRYLSKGRQVAIQGRIQTGSYKDKDGKMVYTTDIVAERVEFIGGGQSDVEAEKTPQRSKSDRTEAYALQMPKELEEKLVNAFQATTEDIPF